MKLIFHIQSFFKPYLLTSFYHLLFVFPLIFFMPLILDGILISTVVSYTQQFLKEPDLILDYLLLFHPLKLNDHILNYKDFLYWILILVKCFLFSYHPYLVKVRAVYESDDFCDWLHFKLSSSWIQVLLPDLFQAWLSFLPNLNPYSLFRFLFF